MQNQRMFQALLGLTGYLMAGIAHADQCTEFARQFEMAASDTLILEKRAHSLLESAASCAEMDGAINEWRAGLERRKRAVGVLEEHCKDDYYQDDQGEMNATTMARKDSALTKAYEAKRGIIGCVE